MSGPIKVYQRLTVVLKDGAVAHFMGPAYQWPDGAEVESIMIGETVTLPDGLSMAQDDTGHFQLLIDKNALSCQQ